MKLQQIKFSFELKYVKEIVRETGAWSPDQITDVTHGLVTLAPLCLFYPTSWYPVAWVNSQRELPSALVNIYRDTKNTQCGIFMLWPHSVAMCYYTACMFYTCKSVMSRNTDVWQNVLCVPCIWLFFHFHIWRQRQWQQNWCLLEEWKYLQFETTESLKIKDNQFDNSVVIGDTARCHYDHLQCHQWWQSCETDDLWYRMIW